MLQVGNHYFITHSMWIAALTVLIYDYCLTFRDEVQYVWSGSRVSPSRLLFTLNRYWPLANILVDNISRWLRYRQRLASRLRGHTVLATISSDYSRFCRIWLNYVAYSSFPIHFAIGAIQILRIHAMYNRNRRLLAVVCTLFVFDLGVGTVVIGFVAHQFQPVPLPPGFTGCIPTHIPPYAWVYWLPMLIMEIVMFGLSAIRSAESMRSRMRLPFIMSVLFRDSVIYFAGVMGSVVVNFVVWKAARQQLFTAVLPIAFAMHSIIGCRMLLNIQKAIRPYSVSFNMQRPPVSVSSTTLPGPESSTGPSDYYPQPVHLKPQALGHVGFPPDLKDPRSYFVSHIPTPSASSYGAFSSSDV